ncbi:MAG TPA: hypothetical protein VEY91_01770 [Candidatus Limnocylindria bacterium]|nr:hypothetical protein [Candidatus Limnocylindria bacterium]
MRKPPFRTSELDRLDPFVQKVDTVKRPILLDQGNGLHRHPIAGL